MKEYGQNLKEKRNKLITQLSNLNRKIQKRFDLIMDDYSDYVSEKSKSYYKKRGYILCEAEMLDIIIEAEKKYVEQHSKQLDFFK